MSAASAAAGTQVALWALADTRRPVAVVSALPGTRSPVVSAVAAARRLHESTAE